MPDDEDYESSADLEDNGVLDASDTLEGDPGDDPLDTGIAPPDRWSAGEGFGTTEAEERTGESLDQLLAEEEPDIDPYAGDEARDVPTRRGTGAPSDADDEDTSGTLFDDVPDERAGRLVAENEGRVPDEEPDLVARDVGIDAGAAGAEEAAVHVIGEDEQDSGGTG
jgi:hypothetical protein